MPKIKNIIFTSIRGVLPVALIIILLQFTFAEVQWEVFFNFLIGAIMAIAGLALFFLGAHLGLLPLGESFGGALARTGKLWLVLLCAIILGYAITIAEPAIRVLAGQVDTISSGDISKNNLIHIIGLGVAIFIGLAALRIIRGISLKLILTISYALILILTFLTPDPFIPISYDSGGVTTGTVTVPFILAFGMGMALFLRAKDASNESFGMVALASIGPILAMLLLALFSNT